MLHAHYQVDMFSGKEGVSRSRDISSLLQGRADRESKRRRGREGSALDDSLSLKTREENRSFAYLRNLLYTRKFVIVHLLFLLPRRSDGPAGTKATVNVLWFLLRWFQDL